MRVKKISHKYIQINGRQVANLLFLRAHFPPRCSPHDIQAYPEAIRWIFRAHFRRERLPDQRRFSASHYCLYIAGAFIDGLQTVSLIKGTTPFTRLSCFNQSA